LKKPHSFIIGKYLYENEIFLLLGRLDQI
jgi:hypothetical protein